jgi:hypothetical protein
MKKIIREEMDGFEWAREEDPIADYKAWLWSPDMLYNDARELVGFAEGLMDSELSIESRQRFLDDYESYAALGYLIEETHRYFRYVLGYCRFSGKSEEEVVKMAETILNSLD